MKYYNLTPEKTAEKLNVDIELGLSAEQVAQKQQVCGKNQISQKQKGSLLSRFASKFHNFTLLILIAAALISAIVAFVGKDYIKLISAIVIIAVVILNSVSSVMQENKAENEIASLDKRIVSKVKVLRDGQKAYVEAIDLLPGDVMFVQAGDMIPADGRLVACSQLKVDESLLTNERLLSEKNTQVISGDNHSVSQLHNCVFAGTMVMQGKAKIIVTAIGDETQIVKSGVDNNTSAEKTPLQIQVAQMSKVLSLAVLAICVVIFLLGILQKNSIADMLLLASALAVAAIPEGLSTTVTSLLAQGAHRMADESVLVRKRGAVENLGNVDVICTNMTGTLTQNRMTVSACYAKDSIYPFVKENFRNVAELIFYGSMCNDAYFTSKDGQTVCVGDPTEGAIIEALESMGKNRMLFDSEYPKMGKIDFDTVRRCKSTIHIIGGRNLVIVKGSPDVIFSKCLDDDQLESARKAADMLASKAMRVLAVAVKEIDEIPAQLFAEDIENGLTFVGLIGMTDALHNQTKSSLAACVSAGIRPIMITGDHIVTACAAAKEMGIFRDGDKSLTATQFDALSDEEFETNIESYSVYSGIKASHKERIVAAWQKQGKAVAFIGEGLADAGALQAADVGCVIESAASDVAKNAADVVLTDDNFETVVSAVQKARGIYNNIKKTLKFLLSGNIGEVLLILISVLLFSALPLAPLNLLWINLVTDMFPALSLGAEYARVGLMSRPPRDKKETLLTKEITIDGLWQGGLIALVSLFGYLIGTGFAPRTNDALLIAQGQTITFAILSFSQIFHAYDSRSRHCVFGVGIFGNKQLNISVLISIALMLLVLLVPGIMNLFGTVYLNFGQWVIIIVLSLVPFAVCEIVKIIKARG